MKTTLNCFVFLVLAMAGCVLDPVDINATGTPPVTFSRADHDLCDQWPVCPVGVLSPADHTKLRAFSTSCRAKLESVGGPLVNCGPCIDTRTPSCEPFVGRCMAPNWPTGEDTGACAVLLPEPRQEVNAYTICTGAVQDGPDAATVCED